MRSPCSGSGSDADRCTTSLVPSGNVASTWMSWIISAMPSITCARVSTWAPASISSATVLPSRAPSRMKSVISATASGWLSLTPRSSRRRATIAAMAISSLSFSRGVRFIDVASSIQPEPRQRRAPSAASTATRSRRSAAPSRGAEPRDREPVPGRDADLAAESSQRADRARPSPRRRARQHGGDGDAAAGDRRLAPACRRSRRRAARSRRRRAGRRGARASGRRTRPARTASPMAGAAEHHGLGQQQRARSAQDRPRCGASSRARSNRMVSCGSQASARAGADVELDVDRRRRARARGRPSPPPRW